MESSELKEKWMCDNTESSSERDKKDKKKQEELDNSNKYNPLRDN